MSFFSSLGSALSGFGSVGLSPRPDLSGSELPPLSGSPLSAGARSGGALRGVSLSGAVFSGGAFWGGAVSGSAPSGATHKVVPNTAVATAANRPPTGLDQSFFTAMSNSCVRKATALAKQTAGRATQNARPGEGDRSGRAPGMPGRATVQNPKPASISAWHDGSTDDRRPAPSSKRRFCSSKPT